MKLVFNKLIPFKGFIAINLFGVCFIREEYKDKLGKINLEDVINHEMIHTQQMKEMLYVGFYLWYFFEWLIKLFKYGKDAYYHISFEVEAFLNERDLNYIERRKPFAWWKNLNGRIL